MQQQQNFERLVDYLLEGGFFLQEAVELIERTFIARVLVRTGGNCTAASKQLGIHRNTLQRKMVEFELTPKRRARVRRKPAGRAAAPKRKRRPAA